MKLSSKGLMLLLALCFFIFSGFFMWLIHDVVGAIQATVRHASQTGKNYSVGGTIAGHSFDFGVINSPPKNGLVPPPPPIAGLTTSP